MPEIIATGPWLLTYLYPAFILSGVCFVAGLVLLRLSTHRFAHYLAMGLLLSSSVVGLLLFGLVVFGIGR